MEIVVVAIERFEYMRYVMLAFKNGSLTDCLEAGFCSNDDIAMKQWRINEKGCIQISSLKLENVAQQVLFKDDFGAVKAYRLDEIYEVNTEVEEIVDVEETTSIASDSENIAALIFPTEDVQEVMVLHCCLGEVVVEIDSSGITEIPVVKTRSEGGANGIKYGEVCSAIAAAKAVKAIEKKYSGKCYELRIEPTGNGCKTLYHHGC